MQFNRIIHDFSTWYGVNYNAPYVKMIDIRVPTTTFYTNYMYNDSVYPKIRWYDFTNIYDWECNFWVNVHYPITEARISRSSAIKYTKYCPIRKLIIQNDTPKIDLNTSLPIINSIYLYGGSLESKLSNYGLRHITLFTGIDSPSIGELLSSSVVSMELLLGVLPDISNLKLISLKLDYENAILGQHDLKLVPKTLLYLEVSDDTDTVTYDLAYLSNIKLMKLIIPYPGLYRDINRDDYDFSRLPWNTLKYLEVTIGNYDNQIDYREIYLYKFLQKYKAMYEYVDIYIHSYKIGEKYKIITNIDPIDEYGFWNGILPEDTMAPVIPVAQTILSSGDILGDYGYSF